MFLFGILSSPLPYLLMAVFYFFGFATGMFSKEAADPVVEVQIEVNSIQVDSSSKVSNKPENTFHFHQYKCEKKVVDCVAQSPQPPGCFKEKPLFFIHEIKIPHTTISDYSFCRPPPVIG